MKVISVKFSMHYIIVQLGNFQSTAIYISCPSFDNSKLPKMRSKENVLCIVMFTLMVMLNDVVIGDLELNGHFTRLKGKCDMSRGIWVHDNSYPLYDSFQCPFIFEKFDCQKNDRRDKSYLKYRWQPSSCDIPKYI